MGRLICQLPADIMMKLHYALLYSYLTYTILAWGSSGHTNAVNPEQPTHKNTIFFLSFCYLGYSETNCVKFNKKYHVNNYLHIVN